MSFHWSLLLVQLFLHCCECRSILVRMLVVAVGMVGPWWLPVSLLWCHVGIVLTVIVIGSGLLPSSLSLLKTGVVCVMMVSVLSWDLGKIWSQVWLHQQVSMPCQPISIVNHRRICVHNTTTASMNCHHPNIDDNDNNHHPTTTTQCWWTMVTMTISLEGQLSSFFFFFFCLTNYLPSSSLAPSCTHNPKYHEDNSSIVQVVSNTLCTYIRLSPLFFYPSFYWLFTFQLTCATHMHNTKHHEGNNNMYTHGHQHPIHVFFFCLLL